MHGKSVACAPEGRVAVAEREDVLSRHALQAEALHALGRDAAQRSADWTAPLCRYAQRVDGRVGRGDLAVLTVATLVLGEVDDREQGRRRDGHDAEAQADRVAADVAAPAFSSDYVGSAGLQRSVARGVDVGCDHAAAWPCVSEEKRRTRGVLLPTEKNLQDQTEQSRLRARTGPWR